MNTIIVPREEFILGTYHSVTKFLKGLKQSRSQTYLQLQEKSGLSGGSFAMSMKDAEIMMLWKQIEFSERKLTELGEKWIQSCEEKGDNTPSDEILKEACLNAPLFKYIFDIDNKTTSRQRIMKLIKQRMGDTVVDRDVSRIAKRYLEGVHGFFTNRRPRITYSNIRQLQASDKPNKITEKPQTSTNNESSFADAAQAYHQVYKLVKKIGKDHVQLILDMISEDE